MFFQQGQQAEPGVWCLFCFITVNAVLSRDIVQCHVAVLFVCPCQRDQGTGESQAKCWWDGEYPQSVSMWPQQEITTGIRSPSESLSVKCCSITALKIKRFRLNSFLMTKISSESVCVKTTKNIQWMNSVIKECFKNVFAHICHLLFVPLWYLNTHQKMLTAKLDFTHNRTIAQHTTAGFSGGCSLLAVLAWGITAMSKLYSSPVWCSPAVTACLQSSAVAFMS